MGTILVEDIRNQLANYLTEVYKHLHQHPEPSNHEWETQKYIIRELEDNQIPYKVMAETGVCAEIRGAKAGKTILLRADMDALEIMEDTGLPYASQKDGLMHACGHDAHVAVGLGVAKLLGQRADDLCGTVKIMFQPAEEKPPGGAMRMIKEGILENPKVDAVIGIHTNPHLPAGQFGLIDGCILAASDRIFITLSGKGGHAAAPHEGIDAIAMAGQFLANIQNIVSRQVSPTDPAVVTIGKIAGGTRPNVLADRVVLEGTARAIREETRDLLAEKIEKALLGVTEYWGGSFMYEYVKGYPPTWNDKSMTDLIRKAVEECMGKENIYEMENCLMSGDDFAYLAKEAPSVFIEWGTGTPELDNYPWHHPKFHVNLEALPCGVAVVTQSILHFLGEE
ncbi:M20 metallopeptidase family protein [Brevibacillus reuszeri]|uniref:M20 metallopeptidase family protein n=1 Tax=Brevibacillus reuszeri TaxID=54915 RepID=UPI003D2486AA